MGKGKLCRMSSSTTDACDEKDNISAASSVDMLVAEMRSKWSTCVGPSATEHGVRQRQKKRPLWMLQKPAADATRDTTTEVAAARYDILGTAEVNELVLRHSPLPSTDPDITVFKGTREVKDGRKLFRLHRLPYNIVKTLVHPLHNFLQYHHGLHNADEIQIMLMPLSGPLSGTGAGSTGRKRKRSAESKTTTPSSSLRHCFVATNNETLTEEALSAAVLGWGTPGVLHIEGFTLVRGEKGVHAEVKLLEYLRNHCLTTGSPRRPLEAQEKVLVLGERLPCAACRLFAVPYEAYAQLLPSHGHMYLSTMETMIRREPQQDIAPPTQAPRSRHPRPGDEGTLLTNYLSPEKSALLLLEKGRARVLQ